jgi:integrase
VRYRGSIPEARSKVEAETVEVQKKREVYEGRYGRPTGDESFARFVRDSYLPWAKLNKRSWYDDQLITTMLCEHFQCRSFNQITPKLVERFKVARAKERTKYDRERQPATVNRELAVLSKIFTLAVREGVAAANPCNEVERLYVSNNRVRYLSPEEEERLLSVLTGEREHLWPIVMVDIYTGLRKGELLNLRKDELDFNFGVIQLRKTKSRRGHVIVGRTVPMESVVKKLLWAEGRQRDGEFVFINPKTGKPYTDVKKAFAKACQKAKLKDFTFHDLRHTFGTRLAEQNVDVVRIKELMGHQSIETTMRYMHATDRGKRAAVAALSAYREKHSRKFPTNEERLPEQVAVSR